MKDRGRKVRVSERFEDATPMALKREKVATGQGVHAASSGEGGIGNQTVPPVVSRRNAVLSVPYFSPVHPILNF